MFLQYRSCSKSLTPSLRESRIHLRFAKVAYLRALRRMSHKNSMYWIFMRDLADLAPPVVKTGGAQISEMAEDSKYASSRIKIQWIEFLCERLDPEVAYLRALRL